MNKGNSGGGVVFRTGKEEAPYKLVGVMITSTHGEFASISC